MPWYYHSNHLNSELYISPLHQKTYHYSTYQNLPSSHYTSELTIPQDQHQWYHVCDMSSLVERCVGVSWFPVPGSQTYARLSSCYKFIYSHFTQKPNTILHSTLYNNANKSIQHMHYTVPPEILHCGKVNWKLGHSNAERLDSTWDIAIEFCHCTQAEFPFSEHNISIFECRIFFESRNLGDLFIACLQNLHFRSAEYAFSECRISIFLSTKCLFSEHTISV